WRALVMTRLTLKEARALGIIQAKPKKKVSPKTTLPRVQWDARTFAGGLWLQIPEVPPSLNVWKNWHWAKQHRYKEELKADISKLAIAFKLPKFRRATVLIKYYFGTNRRRDPADNYAPKFLMDALVNAGILKDDNGDLVTVQVAMEVDREKPRTEVFIWEGK
ncbi:RusA family crossover junction endodeoxyribonuclease, partial [Desulforamulus aquiferis]